jgi:hypothetical protein
LQDLPKFIQKGIFGLNIYYLVTLAILAYSEISDKYLQVDFHDIYVEMDYLKVEHCQLVLMVLNAEAVMKLCYLARVSK